MEFKKSDIRKELESFLSLVEKEMQWEGIQTIRKFDSNTLSVYIDTDGIRQVFLNIINNAKFAMQGGLHCFYRSANSERKLVLLSGERFPYTKSRKNSAHEVFRYRRGNSQRGHGKNIWTLFNYETRGKRNRAGIVRFLFNYRKTRWYTWSGKRVRHWNCCYYRSAYPKIAWWKSAQNRLRRWRTPKFLIKQGCDPSLYSEW